MEDAVDGATLHCDAKCYSPKGNNLLMVNLLRR